MLDADARDSLASESKPTLTLNTALTNSVPLRWKATDWKVIRTPLIKKSSAEVTDPTCLWDVFPVVLVTVTVSVNVVD